MPKKITIDHFNSIHSIDNVVDSLLEREMSEIEQRYGKMYEGLSTKILSLFSAGGRRVQLSEEEVVKVLEHSRQVKKEVVYDVLRQMEGVGLIRCTNGGRYELANNTLVQRADKKVAAENSLLRNMRLVIRDHAARGEKLDAQYLDHIAPFITRLELAPDEMALVEASREAVKKEKRRRVWFVGMIFAVLLAATALSLFNFIRAENEAQRANIEKNTSDSLRLEAVRYSSQVDAINDQLIEKNAELEAARDTADQNRILADIRALEADMARDSLSKEKVRVDSLNNWLNAALVRQKDATDEARKQREEADALRQKAERSSELIEAEKVRADKYAVSLNAALRSTTIEDSRVQALVAKKAFDLYSEYLKGDDYRNKEEANHPSIFNGLYQGLKSLDKDRTWEIRQHEGPINDILVHPNGKQIITVGTGEEKVVIWNIPQWNTIGAPDLKEEDFDYVVGLDEDIVYETVDISADNQYLLLAGQSDRIAVIDYQRKNRDSWKYLDPRNSRMFEYDRLYQVAFANADNNAEFLALSRESYLFHDANLIAKSPLLGDALIKPKMHTRANTMVKHQGKTYGLAAQTNIDVYGGTFIKLQVMSAGKIEEDQLYFDRKGDKDKFGQPVAIAASQRERGVLAVGMENGHILISEFDIQKRTGSFIPPSKLQAQIFKPHQAAISDIAISEDERYLAISSLDGTISVWDLNLYRNASYQPIILDDHRDWVTALAFAQKGRMLLAGTQDGIVHFWNFHAPDYAKMICRVLPDLVDEPNYDRIDGETWRRYFGTNIEIRNDQICR